jgi:branched-chain amino acid transport system substrate-binding protein
MKHGLLGALAAGLTVGILSAHTQPPVPTPSTIDIGVEAPSGSFSLDEENLGMRVLVEELNATGGIHGRQLRIREYAHREFGQGEVFLLFNFGGPGSVKVAAFAAANRVPYLFPHTALITTHNRYVFTSFPLYEDETRIMFRFLATQRRARRVAVVHDANPYGLYFRDRLREMSGALGYEAVGVLQLKRNPGDVTTDVETLRRAEPDHVVLALFPDQAKSVMSAKATLEWKVAMVTSGPLTDEQYLQSGGVFAEGTLGFCHFADPERSDAPGIRMYRDVMTRRRPNHALNRYSLYGYTFGRLVAEGLMRAGQHLTQERFIDAMETIAAWDAGGVLPPVTFSSRNHHAQRAGFICELRGGRFRPISGWIAP